MSILELNKEGRYISVDRGLVQISDKNGECGEVPTDLLTAVIVTGRGISFSNSVLTELSERNVPVVFCGHNYSPVGMLTGIDGNCRQAEVMSLQVDVSIPFTKNGWKDIVKFKIGNQARVLEYFSMEFLDLECIKERVQSGDTANCEATASRIYFPRLFGDGFTRGSMEGGINASLNYGYAVIRAAMARYVVAAGLLPSFGIHHKNMLNAFSLVDDLMEPYRPVVDLSVKEFAGENGDIELTPERKKELAGLLEKPIKRKDCESPLRICMQKTVWSLVDSLKSGEVSLSYEKSLI